MKMIKKLSKRAIALFSMLAMIAGCVLTYTGPLGEANSASAINDEWNMFSSEEGVNIVDGNGKVYKYYNSASVDLPEGARSMNDLELHIKVWLKDTDAVNVMKATTVELANNQYDQMERYWGLSGEKLVPGMNEIALKLSKSYAHVGTEGVAFDMAQTIKAFRMYSTTADTTTANSILLYDVTLRNDNAAGLNFGLNDSHLQLSNKLTAAPEAIESSVKMNKAQYEWVLRSAQDTSWSYGLGTNATYHTVADGENGPEEGTSYATATMSSGGNFGFTKSFNISIPEYYTVDDIALDFWFKTDTKEATMGYIDLTSAGTYSDERRYFNMNTYLKDVVEGEWYHVVIPVSKGVQDGANPNKFNLQEVDYLRWHSTKITGESVHYSITDIKLVVLAAEEEQKVATKWPLFAASEASAGTQLEQAAAEYNANNVVTKGTVGEGEKGPKVGTPYTQISVTAGQPFGFQNKYRGIASIPATGAYKAEDLVVKFWLWCEKEDVLPTTYFSLSTEGWRTTQAAYWTLNNYVALNAGWNYVELRLDDCTKIADGFDYTNIRYVGVFSSEPWNAELEKYAPLTVSEDCSFKMTDIALEVRPDYNMDANTILKVGSTLDAAGTYAYSTQTISNGYVTGDEADEFTPAEGTAYTQFEIAEGGNFGFKTVFKGIPEGIAPITSEYEENELAISFWLYNESGVQLPNWSRLRLSSHGWTGTDERCIVLHPIVKLQQGWNYVQIPITESIEAEHGTFDYTNIRFLYFYWHNALAAKNTFKVCDVKLVPLDSVRETKTLATIRSAFDVVNKRAAGWWYSSKTNAFALKEITVPTVDGPEYGTNYAKIDITTAKPQYSFTQSFDYRVPEKYDKEDIALSFWLYSSFEGTLPSGRQIAFNDEAAVAADNLNANDVWWDWSKIPLKKGWNYIQLNFADAIYEGEFDIHTMSTIRWYGSDFTSDVTLGISDMKLVLVNEPHKVITTEVTDTTTLQYNQMIFSNVNATGETSPYALYLNREGQPTLLWGTTAFTLDYDVRTGKWVDIKAVRNADKTVSFYIDGELIATSSTKDLLADDELSFTTAHRIAADGIGSQLFVGRIANLKIYSDGEATTCAGNWPLTGDIQYILTPMEDKSGNNNTAVYRGTRAEDWIDYDKTQYDFLYNENGEEDYWSMVFIPDIQNMTQDYYGYDKAWYQTAQWIADNVETENIKHVIGAGDSTWTNVNAEYTIAKAGFDKFTDKVSWSNNSGNHEYYDWSKVTNRADTLYDDYFGVDYIQETKAAETYMGSFDDPQKLSTTENSFYRFNVNDVNWMIIQLEYHPRLSVLNWAKEVAAKYPADNVIITTHSYLSGSGGFCNEAKDYIVNGDGEQYLGKSTERIWQELQSTSNIKLILCGHAGSKNGSIVLKNETNTLGQTVPAMMINAQGMDMSEPGGNTAYYSDKCLGMLAIFRFSPDGSQVAMQWYSPQWGKTYNPIGADGTRNSNDIVLSINKEAQVEKFTNVTAGVAPATEDIPEGYVFAGWYTDNTCTKALKPESTAETAYAKFVDAKILDVKAQVRLDENKALPAEAEGTDMRFVTTVDTADYKKVGFHIVCKTHRIDKFVETTKVYKKLYKVGQTSGEPDTVLPTEFSPVSEYFLTYTLLGVNEYDVEIEMTPYWVTADGTTVYGQTATKSVSQFNKQ